MTSAGSLINVGAEFHRNGDLVAAKLHYEAALLSEPNNIAALMNLSDVLSSQQKVRAAAALVSRVTSLMPNMAGAWANYGNFLTRLDRLGAAREALEIATNLAPDSIGNWHNFMLLALRSQDFEGARLWYEKILALGGDSPAVRNDYAHALLARGDLKSAFELYESRWHTLLHLEPWDMHVPEWQGEPLASERILIHAEQGLGDTIMTSRFLHDLWELDPAAITFAVPNQLVRLFQMQEWPFEVVSIHDIDESWASRFDFHSPLYSMMRHLEVEREDINGRTFLKAPALTVPPVHAGMFNVGICWASGTHHDYTDWRRRVSPLADWLPLAEVPGVQLWSLFPGDEAQREIVGLGAEAVVLDRVTKFEDFAETTAFVSSLDLVISVDTAVAHLSGALGVPTWMLSQFAPCWRWWGLDEGTGAPWYDSMLTFKQHAPGDWKSQLEECVRLLQLRVEGRRKLAEAAE